MRACVATVHDADISVNDLSITDLEAMSSTAPSSEKVAGLFSSFEPTADSPGNFLVLLTFSMCYFLF